MKPYTCPEVDRSLWLYIDRELSASELARISSHLRDCSACSALYHQRARDARLYRMAFAETPFGDKFAGKLRRKMVEDGQYGDGQNFPAVAFSGLGTDVSPRSSVSRRWGLFWLHRGRRRRLVTVLAMLVMIPIIVIIGVVSNGPTPESLGWLTAEQGSVFTRFALPASAIDPSLPAKTATRDLVETPVTRQTAICAGLVCVVREGSVAKLRLHAVDGEDVGGRRRSGEGDSWATVQGPAVLSLDPQATRRRFMARLDGGHLEAHVAPRSPESLFRIDTPHAHATVIGTHFELTVRAAETLLFVHVGKVSFGHAEALPGEGSELVTPVSGLFVARAGESRPVAHAATVPAPAPGVWTDVVPEPDPELEASPGPARSEPEAQIPPLRPDVDLDQPVNGDPK